MEFFSNYISTDDSEKESEIFTNALFNCLFYKILTSSKDSDDKSIGFHRSLEERIGNFCVHINDDTIGKVYVQS